MRAVSYTHLDVYKRQVGRVRLRIGKPASPGMNVGESVGEVRQMLGRAALFDVGDGVAAGPVIEIAEQNSGRSVGGSGE